MVCKQVKTKARAEDIVTEQTCLTRLRQSLLENFVGFKNFTVNVVVATRNAHGVGGNGHAFDQRVRIVANDVAVFKRARLAFIGITHQIFLPWVLTRHEAPLQTGWEARATTATQS